MKDYMRYRWFYTSSGKLVVGGKNEKQNDELLKGLDRERVIMHSSGLGSPFCVILSDIKKLSREDLEECAIFTGCFSKEWKKGKRKSKIHVFKTSQISKKKSDKPGLWRVSGRVDTIEVSLSLTLIKQKRIWRAVPDKTYGNFYVKILPGRIDKKDLMGELRKKLGKSFNEEQLMSALPAGGLKIKLNNKE